MNQPPAIPAESFDNIKLHQLAQSHRRLIYCLLAQILCVICLPIVSSMTPTNAEQQKQLLPVIMSLFLLVVFAVAVAACIGGLVYAFRTMGLLGHSLFSQIAVVVLLLMPCIGPVTLLVISQEAIKALRSKGVKIGFLGADMSSIPSVATEERS